MRIPDYINTLLEKDANSKGISVNALISMIMTKYAE
jgi:predicted HicB family RNase H-like nuclease